MQTLPNGYLVDGNSIYGLDGSDNFYLDDWVRYLDQDGTVVVYGQGGDDNISSGNVTTQGDAAITCDRTQWLG